DALKWFGQDFLEFAKSIPRAHHHQPRGIIDPRADERGKVGRAALEITEIGIANHEQRSHRLSERTTPSIESGPGLLTGGLLEEQDPERMRRRVRIADPFSRHLMQDLVGDIRLDQSL